MSRLTNWKFWCFNLIFIFFLTSQEISCINSRNGNSDDILKTAHYSTALSAPVILHEPKSHYTSFDDPDVRINCIATGNPLPKIFWIKNGKNITNYRSILIFSDQTTKKKNETESTLVFLHLWAKDKDSEGNEGDYQCLAKNIYGSALSSVAKIYIKSIGEFIKNPIDKEGKLGSTAKIECVPPVGLPKPTVTWLYQVSLGSNLTKVVTGSRIQIKDGNLIISNVKSSDKGFYTCVANNSAGTKKSYAAEFRVTEPPIFALLPKDQTAKIGESVTFRCSAFGDPKPWIEWYKDSKAITTFPEYGHTYLREGDYLKIEVTKSSDAGAYTCKAKNNAYVRDYRAHLEVDDPPRIVSSSLPTVVKEGEDVEIFCSVKGHPLPMITWFGIKGENLRGLRYPDKLRVFANANGRLNIREVNKNDAGLYRCMCENGQERSINLTVIDRQDTFPPVVELSPYNSSVVMGDVITLHCRIQSSTSQLEIKWLKDDVPLSSQDRVVQKTVKNGKDLSIFNSQLNDAGKFTCQVSNSLGQSSDDAFVLIHQPGKRDILTGKQRRDPPAEVEDIKLKSSTPNSLTIEWSTTESKERSSVLFYQLSYFSANSLEKVWKTFEKIKATSFTVTDLQPSTAYYFSVRAINQFQRSKPFTTMSPFYTQDSLSVGVKDESEIETTINSIIVNVTDATPIEKAGERLLQLRWVVNKDPCEIANGFLIFIHSLTKEQKLQTRLSAVSCNERFYNIFNLTIGSHYLIQIGLYRDKLTAISSPIVSVSSKGEVVAAASLAIATTKVIYDHSDVQVTWSFPNSRHVINNMIILICEAKNYREVIYRSDYEKTATCQRVPQTLKSINISLEYLHHLGSKSYRQVSLLKDTQPIDGDLINNDSSNFLSSPTGIAVIAMGSLLFILTIVGVGCYIRRRRNPKSRDRAVHSFSFTPHSGARRTGRFDQPPSYVQNFDLTLADPTLGPKNGDTSYIKMNESRVMGNGNGNKIYAPREHQPKSCTGGKIQMSSYQPSLSTGNEGRPSLGFSYVNDQLISVSSITPQFKTSSAPRATTIPSVTQQSLQQHHDNLQRQMMAASNEQTPSSPPLSQRTRLSDRSVNSGSALQSNGGRSSSSGQRRRRSLRSNNITTSRPSASTLHSNYSNTNIASTVAVATIDTVPFHQRKHQHMEYGGNQSHEQLNQQASNSYGSAGDIEEEQDEDPYTSSGEDSFDMPSASQVGTNIDYQHINQNVPIRQQFPNHHEYLPTLEEVGHGRKDTDPLLMKCTQSSDVSRHLRQNGTTGSINGTRTDNISRGSSMTSSYHHHTGDSGMSAGVGSTEQSSLRSEAGPQLQSQQHYVQIDNRRPAFIDDKFVGTLSPPPSAVSMQSGYNSTASSCWQYQPTNPKLPSTSLKQKPWRHLHETCAKKSIEEKRNNSEDIIEFSDRIEITIANRTHTEPNYQNIHYDKNAKSSDSLKKANTVPVNGFSIGEVSTSDFYSDQSQ